MLLTTLCLIAVVIALLYVFLVWNFDYWKKRNVKGPKPLPFLGNFPSIATQKRHFVYDVDDIYRAYKNVEDFVGVFNCRSPQLLVTSPKMARQILVTDFKHFRDNDVSTIVDEKSDLIFANNPFSMTGDAWKERRALLTPALAMSKVKTVYPTTKAICKRMMDYIRKEIKLGPKDGLDAKDLSLRYTTEVVTDCVMGLNADSFGEKPTPIKQMIRSLFEPSVKIILYMVAVSLLPWLKKYYKLTLIQKPTRDFFTNLVQNAIQVRKTQEKEWGGERDDFLNYMLKLQEKKGFSIDMLLANTMTFLLDGFETTAVAISHCLLLLGRDKDIQQKLREELSDHRKENNDFDFDELNELPYLDACVHESLRIFPPGTTTQRLCTEPIELCSKSGQTVQMEKGDTVTVSFYSMMRDEFYYPDPEKFNPDRFALENGGVKKYRDMGVYQGFGDGPRICIGMRFALVQVKAAIAEIVTNFEISCNPKTRNDNQLDPKIFLGTLKGGVWLDLNPLK